MLKTISLKIIEIYQSTLRLLLPSNCCFFPSCSEYARQAILKYGFLKGSFKGLSRLLGCHPFNPQTGYAPLK